MPSRGVEEPGDAFDAFQRSILALLATWRPYGSFGPLSESQPLRGGGRGKVHWSTYELLRRFIARSDTGDESSNM